MKDIALMLVERLIEKRRGEYRARHYSYELVCKVNPLTGSRRVYLLSGDLVIGRWVCGKFDDIKQVIRDSDMDAGVVYEEGYLFA